ncbi:MAG: DUF192 domain-containing protein [Candidatus Obscuribacter sp.]|nr:DUF192 domain-containing protein [Candidatus Obscuribacter sp.]
MLPKNGTYCRINNATKDSVLAERAKVARSFFTRLKGLLGTESLAPGSGLWIEPCAAIHMFGMRYAIDAVFVDKHNVVVGFCIEIPPGAVSPNFKGARSCIELSSGSIICSGTQVGDTITWSAAE